MSHECKWAVIATCTAKNNGIEENFDCVIALFLYPLDAEDFIAKCIPPENRSRFRVDRVTE